MELRVLKRDETGRGGVEPADKRDWPRPELTVIQGGAPRRARPRSQAMRMALESPPAEHLAEVEEIPVYLRPIPSWVPRLW